MEIRRALITGVSGQDGSYLAELLHSKGYEVVGTQRRQSEGYLGRLAQATQVFDVDLMQPQLLGDLILRVRPTEVYHLAAHHFSSDTDAAGNGDLDPFVRVNLAAANNALEAIRSHLPGCRFFYAASSHVFGTPSESPQTESTPHSPETPYAITKSAAVHLCRYFRRAHGVYACAGILYNHESPRRGSSFITTRLARAAAWASMGRPEPVLVRDLDATVDWGAAQDYVRAMWLTLQQDAPDEYIVAGGVGRTVSEFAETAFKAVGLPFREFVHGGFETKEEAIRPLVGNSRRLRERTGWRPQIGFPEMVDSMVRAHIDALRRARPVVR